MILKEISKNFAGAIAPAAPGRRNSAPGVQIAYLVTSRNRRLPYGFAIISELPYRNVGRFEVAAIQNAISMSTKTNH